MGHLVLQEPSFFFSFCRMTAISQRLFERINSVMSLKWFSVWFSCRFAKIAVIQSVCVPLLWHHVPSCPTLNVGCVKLSLETFSRLTSFISHFWVLSQKVSPFIYLWSCWKRWGYHRHSSFVILIVLFSHCHTGLGSVTSTALDDYWCK